MCSSGGLAGAVRAEQAGDARAEGHGDVVDGDHVAVPAGDAARSSTFIGRPPSGSAASRSSHATAAISATHDHERDRDRGVRRVDAAVAGASRRRATTCTPRRPATNGLTARPTRRLASSLADCSVANSTPTTGVVMQEDATMTAGDAEPALAGQRGDRAGRCGEQQRAEQAEAPARAEVAQLVPDAAASGLVGEQPRRGT